MAEIQPLKAWRYNKELSKDIKVLTSPLFDVVSAQHRKNLKGNPYNSIHISVPSGDQPATSAKQTLDDWKKTGIIEQDQIPGIYVYYQYFKLSGDSKSYCRKGFISSIRLYDWDSKVPEERMILRHENTIQKAVNDRVALICATELNVSPTHGLYSDPSFELESYMDESILNPIYETEDYQGVRDVLSVIHDAQVIKRFQQVLRNQKIILADGHHRYEASLTHCKNKKALNTNHAGHEAYNYHMMFLTNTESHDLRILATHRLIKDLGGLSEEQFMSSINKYFDIIPVQNFCDINEIILGKKWTFGLLFKNKAYQIRLKPSMIESITWPFPPQVKELDLTILHFFIGEKILKIPGHKQRFSDQISFERNFSDCLAKVLRNEEELAIITNEITMQEVTEICKTGFTMPQKSTYFYPKVICGFLFSSIKNDEFEIPSYFRL